MELPFTETEITELYGVLRTVLHRCPANEIRIIAGNAGWDLGSIPDGLDEEGKFTRRPEIESAIDGQWNELQSDIRIRRVRGLARALLQFLAPRGRTNELQDAILHVGFRFENGDFVPVDATGKILP